MNDLAVAFERERYGLLDTSEPETLAVSKELQAERAQDARDRGYTETHDPERQARLAAEQYGASARRGRGHWVSSTTSRRCCSGSPMCRPWSRGPPASPRS